MRRSGAGDQVFQLLCIDAGNEDIGRNPVRTLDEDGQPVDDKSERSTPCIILLQQLDRAKSDLVLAFVYHPAFRFELDAHSVNGLLSVPVRPPDAGILDTNADDCFAVDDSHFCFVFGALVGRHNRELNSQLSLAPRLHADACADRDLPFWMMNLL